MNLSKHPWAQASSTLSPSTQAPMGEALPRRGWWPRRLHHQLALMVSLALVGALSLLGGFTAMEQADIALHNHESKAVAMARQVAIASRNPLMSSRLDQVEELLLRSADSSEVMSLQVLSPHGDSLGLVVRHGDDFQVRHAPQPLRLTPPSIIKPQVTHDHRPDRLVVWQPVVTHLLAGWVRLEYDTRELDALQWRIWRNTLVVAALAVTVCGLVLAWVLKGPVQALERARLFATEITRSDGRQLAIEPGPIEVMELSGALNEASMLMQQQMLIIEDWLAEHREHEARLAERNAQLGAIFSLSRDGLLTLNHEDRVLFANQAFMQLTGLNTSDVVGHSLDELSARLQALAQPGSTFTGLCHAFQTAVAHDPGVRSPLLVLGEGAQRCVLSLTGQRSDSSAVSGVLYLSDVTRQHTLDQMKSEFLSMAAHELRTPMVSIFGFTELMLNREMTPERRKDLLGSIHRHCQSMVSILNELLDLARIESRRGQDFQFEQVDMADVVQSVLADFKPPVGRASPQRTQPPGAMPVRADAHKLQQAVLNILSNAYKYSPDGGEVAVSFLSQPDEQGRHRHGVRIEDHGVGLSPEDQNRLGERFFRVDKSGNIPGTGLGVSIVKELMELMGGRMQVVSALGQGTTVTLWL
jgi:two-component system sensor histidine kinase VicK